MLGWSLAAILGTSVCQAQFGSGSFEEGEAEEARQQAEQERGRLLASLLSERRARAHDRLEGAGSMMQSQAVCPAFLGLSPEPRSFRKRISSPFVARYAPRPVRPPWRGVAPDSESPSGIFSDFISAAVVQSKCINCHVEGGASGHTRLVLTPSEVEGHEATNLAVFQNFLETVEGGADRILNKIQGAESHGGGVQVVAGSTDYANMERFLRALGGETTSGALSPETLFDGVTMATSGRTLRRAALLFAGRLPTPAELGAVSDGEESSLREAIKGLMTGRGFHDFLIRAANDRLLTDRERGERNPCHGSEVRRSDEQALGAGRGGRCERARKAEAVSGVSIPRASCAIRCRARAAGAHSVRCRKRFAVHGNPDGGLYHGQSHGRESVRSDDGIRR